MMLRGEAKHVTRARSGASPRRLCASGCSRRRGGERRQVRRIRNEAEGVASARGAPQGAWMRRDS